MKTNRYRVLKPFTWDGQKYGRGEHLDIEGSHPRIGMMCRVKMMVYDPVRPGELASSPVEEVAVVVAEGTRSVEQAEPVEAQAPGAPVAVDFRPAVAAD